MNYQLRILILDEASDTSSRLEQLFKEKRCLASFHQVDAYEQLVRYLEQHPPDVVLISDRLKQWDTGSILPICRATAEDISIVVIDGEDHARHAVEWMKLGADDYLTVEETGNLPDILSGRQRERTEIAAHLNVSEGPLKFYQLVLDHIPLQIGVYDPDGRYCFVNAAAVKSPEIRQWLIGKTDFDYCRERNVSMTIAEQRHGAIKRCIAEHVTVEIEESFPTHHEGSRYITRFLSPVFDQAGTVIHVVGSSIDITESRRLEAQLQYAQKLESLGVLAGGIAHDFNNLLTVMLGHAELIKSQMSPDSRLYDNVQRIIRSAHRAAGLCQQMLAYAGKGKFVTKPCPLNTIIADIWEFLEVSVSKNVHLQSRLASASPVVEGDPSQLHQVVINLVTNASEAISDKEGVVSITTGAQECDEAYLRNTYVDDELPAGLYAYIEISDTGVGMDEATRLALFDPFYTTKFMGRGLGLAAVLGIVRSHRGAIVIDSKPQKGSTIRVLFPAAEWDASMDQDEGPVEPSWQTSGTVLVVDDEESMLVMTRIMLEKMGFTVLTAMDGVEAVEVFGNHFEDIALVLLDITMPRLNGDDAFWELRKIRDDIPILLLSGYGEQILSRQLFEAGRADFIHKPYGMAELIEKMQALTEH